MSGYLQKPGSVGTTTTINGLSGNVTLSAGQNISLVETGNDIQINANFTQSGKYMISGGATWSGTGLVYDVSFLNYFFDGLKTANQSQVTLAASDPTNNRIDAIVVDEAGIVSVITGDAAASPVEPPIPANQLQVQFILVSAGSLTPTITSEEIYMDDPTTNWTFSTYTTGAATGSINFAGTNSPKQGVNDIEADTDLRLGARFVRSTSFDAYQYTMLQVWVRFTGTAVASNKSLNVRFENSAGTLVGSTVNLFNYGLQRGVLTTWQLVVVPITAFGALPATVKGLKVIMAGGTVGVARQWDLDYMVLTNGSVPYANVPTIAFSKNGTGIASQSGINLIEGTGVTITGVNNPTNNRVDYTINASGGSSPITIGTSGNTLYSSGLSGTGQGAGYNIFLGLNAGYDATGAAFSNFLGQNAGFGATSASGSNFFGPYAGFGATGAAFSNFLGYNSGNNAYNASNSNFLGSSAGRSATNASYSNFLGPYAGFGATGASYSNFLGNSAGEDATDASNSNFLGQNAGINATNAIYSNFLGQNAGNGAYNASNSNFLGQFAGNSATNASNSIFIGKEAGNSDTVNNSTTNYWSILIGDNTSTGGFSNSIAIGKSATNTASNQLMIGNIGNSYSKIDTVIINGTGGIQVPVGTTAERSATQGTIRYNTSTSKFEGYDGSTWVDLN